MRVFSTIFFIPVFCLISYVTCDWTIVGPNKYKIDGAFEDLLPYAESEEYCEFLDENSRLYEPQDEDTRTKVLAAIKDAVDETNSMAFWINAVRKTSDAFEYVSNGAEVEEDAPWKEDEPNDAGDGEGCILSSMDGGWNDIECTKKGYAVCQKPVKWEKVDNDWYTVEDALAKSRTFEEAKNFCESMGDNVILFEPKTVATAEAVATKLELGNNQKLWANAKRGTDHKFHYLSNNEEIPTSSDLWKDGEPNDANQNEDCVLVTNTGEWNDVRCTATNDNRFALCQKPGVTISPNCADTSSHGKFEDLSTDALMENALDHFCSLTDEEKQEFIHCPQVSGDAENFFKLAKALSCTKRDDLIAYISEYTNGCDFVCQGIKAQAFENVKASEEASITYYTNEEKVADDKIDYYQTGVDILTEIYETYTSYKETEIGEEPTLVKTLLDSEIDKKDLTDDEKEDLKQKVETALVGKEDFDFDSYDAINEVLNTEIAAKTSAIDVAKTDKAASTEKKNSLTTTYTTAKTKLKTMIDSDSLSKGTEAVGYVASAVQTFVNADGDVKQIISGVLDLVSALSVFLPPPASEITGLVSSIANMFLGGGSTDTATLIEEEFAKQTEVILDQFEKLKAYINIALDDQYLDEMKILAQGVLADVSAKMIFVDSFRDANMNESLAREIKNEIQIFQHNTDIATFRLTFDENCDDLFENHGQYDVNTDLEPKDSSCLYLAYTYVMIEVTSMSVMTSMINKLISGSTNSGEEYLEDLTVGFLKVQEFQLETDRDWLKDIFYNSPALICAAFRYDSAMWGNENEKEFALMYIGAIDADLKTYIENEDCFGSSDNIDNDNVVHIKDPITLSSGNKITTLDNWGKSFVVDFFLHYSVCPNLWPDTNDFWKISCCFYHEQSSTDRSFWNFACHEKLDCAGCYGWSASMDPEKNILHVTTGTEKTLGYHFPTVNMDSEKKMRIYLPKKDDWKYKVDEDNIGVGYGRSWHHITISQLQEDSDSTNTEHKMVVRVNGVELTEAGGETNNLDDNMDVTVYAGDKEWQSLDTAPLINHHEIHNLRFIRTRMRYAVNVGKDTNYIVRVGPATLSEAQAFCNAEKPTPMVLYKPTYESIHRLIYNKVSKYGATTFWTLARYDYPNGDETDLTSGDFVWITEDKTTTVPDWVKNHWRHTHGMYKDEYKDRKRVGGCTIVGMNDRGSQIAAADCNTEVADIICQLP